VTVLGFLVPENAFENEVKPWFSVRQLVKIIKIMLNCDIFYLFVVLEKAFANGGTFWFSFKELF